MCYNSWQDFKRDIPNEEYYAKKTKISFNKGDRLSTKAKIECDECSLIFIKYHNIEVHIEEMHKAKMTFVCDDCGKGFLVNWQLEKHKTMHRSKG